MLFLLHRTWRNPSAADPAFLSTVVAEAREAEGPILECGSGLTTLVLAATRPDLIDHGLVTLEHDEAWAARNRRRVGRVLGHPPEILLAPLIDYGRFHWYDVDCLELPARFSLVVCDGPPKTTPGGRRGLLSVLHDRLRGSVILLDDAARLTEQEILKRWREEFGVSWELVHTQGHKTFAKVRVPPGTGPSQ